MITPRRINLNPGLDSRCSAIQLPSSSHEAKAYLKHPILGKRLIEISEELLLLPYRDPAEIFGYVDSIKLRSSMTLFHLADPTNHIFRDVLSKFFGGEIDQLTVSLLKSETAI